MNSNSDAQNYSTGSGVNFDVKEQDFGPDEKAVPIAGKYSYPKGGEGSAIGEYKIAPSSGDSLLGSNSGSIDWISTAPSSGTYVLGSIDGVIQWIATEDCDDDE